MLGRYYQNEIVWHFSGYAGLCLKTTLIGISIFVGFKITAFLTTYINNNGPQGFSQDLETGCPKFAIVNFLEPFQILGGTTIY